MTIAFGNYPIRIHDEIGGRSKIYDIVRKKWVVMSPEEQVRQMWLHYLVEHQVSLSQIGVERGLKIGEITKRFDICVFDSTLNPRILIECKAPTIPLKEFAIVQISTYLSVLKAEKFVITNGLQHIGYRIEKNKLIEISTLFE